MSKQRDKKPKPEAQYLSPIEIAALFGCSRSTVDRWMDLDPQHADFLPHLRYGRFRSGARKRKVHREVWRQWLETHSVGGKNTHAPLGVSAPDRQFKPALKTRESFTKVLQKSGAEGEAVENKRETQRGTVL